MEQQVEPFLLTLVFQDIYLLLVLQLGILLLQIHVQEEMVHLLKLL